jgi:hypothetical protein
MNLRRKWVAALVYLFLAAAVTTAQGKKANPFKNSVLIQFDVLHLQEGLPVVSGQSVGAVGTDLKVAISPPTIHAEKPMAARQCYRDDARNHRERHHAY